MTKRFTPTPTIAGYVAARAGDSHIGLRYEDRAWTWAEVVQECAARAAVLDAQRRHGPYHVGVLLDNDPEYVFLLGGAALAGATIVGVNPTRRGDQLAADIRHTDCQLLVTEAAYAPLLDGLDTGIAPDRRYVVGSDGWRNLCAAHANAVVPRVLPGPTTQYVLIFTSGSTGAPKAVRGTQGRYAEFGEHMGFGAGDVLYCPMPLFHGNALAASFVPALRTGATLALRRRFSASELMADVRRYDAVFFNLVGRALSYVLATDPSPHDRDHRVKYALAPESSPVDAAAFQERFGIPILTGYGQSEGAIVIVPVAGGRPGAMGRPPPGADVVIVDAAGVERPRAQFDAAGRLANATEAIGEIVRRDRELRFEGYYANPDAEAQRRRNGWYWSGDLAYRDDDGIFYFAGRTADWMRVDAENFAAAPIERILARHPDVAAVAVYGVPDPVTDDQVMAALELRPGRAFDAHRWDAFLAAQPDLGTKWAPRFVRITAALPTTGIDKIDKKPLRAPAWITDDVVWWRPPRADSYRRLRADDVTALAAQFAAHGRADFVPRVSK
ncbi:MAG: AMP-binding protein [Actinomycetota bacterium]